MNDIIFRADDISKKYMWSGRPVLNHLNMEIRRGEIYGFVSKQITQKKRYLS